MRVRVGYPDPQAEMEMLTVHAQPGRIDELEPVVSAAAVRKLIELGRDVHVADPIREYVVALLGKTRSHPHAQLGASPRAGLMLVRGARVAAAADGREYVVPDDVKELAIPVLAHRIIPTPDAQLSGIDTEDIVSEVLSKTPVPKRL